MARWTVLLLSVTLVRADEPNPAAVDSLENAPSRQTFLRDSLFRNYHVMVKNPDAITYDELRQLRIASHHDTAEQNDRRSVTFAERVARSVRSVLSIFSTTLGTIIFFALWLCAIIYGYYKLDLCCRCVKRHWQSRKTGPHELLLPATELQTIKY